MGGSDATDDELRHRGPGEGEKAAGDGQVSLSTNYIASLDIGTTLMKCLIYDGGAQVIGRHSEPIQIIRSEPNHVEIDPEFLWHQVQICFRKAILDAGITANEVTSIGISTQRNTFTTWHSETSVPFHNFIVWNDQRAIHYVKSWNRSLLLKAYQWGAYALYGLTWMTKFLFASNIEFSLGQVGVRLRWMIDNIPQLKNNIRERKVKFGCIETWLLWKLSGGYLHATDFSCASATGLYDPFILDWSWIMMALSSVPRHIFPEVRNTTGPFCNTEVKTFGASIPINVVIGDQQAAMFGQCGFNRGSVKATFGTGTFCNINTAQDPLSTIAGLYPVIGWRTEEEICYLAEGCSMDTGTTINWAIQAGFFSNPEESSSIAKSVPSSGGVCFIPAFSGIQAPINDDDACTGIIGITATTTKPQIVRAILESLAFRMFHIYTLATSDRGVDISQLEMIRVDGGVSRNQFVMQLVADLTGKMLDFPEDCESSALGAAFLSGIAAGVWKGKEELNQLRRSKGTVHPRSQSERDDVLATFNLWMRAISRCCKWFSA